MKVFFEAIDANGNYADKIKLADIADDVAYARAYKAYSPDQKDWVEECLDGRGYIYLQGVNCRFTYQQDSL